VLAEHNVSITRSLPYTPQLNGKAEAIWRVFDLRIMNRATRVRDYTKYGLAISSYNIDHHHASLKIYNQIGIKTPF